MEKQDRESINFEEMVQRVVNVKAKAGLKSSTMIQDLDIHYPRGHRSSKSTVSKMQTQKTTAKESKPEELKPKKSKSAEGKNLTPPRSKFTKPGKTSCTDKKMEYLKKKRDWKNNTPAIGDKTNTVEGDKKK